MYVYIIYVRECLNSKENSNRSVKIDIRTTIIFNISQNQNNTLEEIS